jgi:hypothetical protein
MYVIVIAWNIQMFALLQKGTAIVAAVVQNLV